MKIKGINNRITSSYPNEVKKFHTKVFALEKAKTFGELSHIAETIASGETFINVYNRDELFTSPVRLACALNLVLDGVKILINRNESIFLGNKEDIPVNIGILDVPIASRVFLPSGDYGLLGKIDCLRGQTENYYGIPISLELDRKNMGFEYNFKTGETCYMILGSIYCEDDDLLQKVLTDEKVRLCTSKV